MRKTSVFRQIKQRGLSVLLIEHKLSLVMELSDRVVVMDNGQKIAEGTPEVVRSDPRVIEAYLGHKQHLRDVTDHADDNDQLAQQINVGLSQASL